MTIEQKELDAQMRSLQIIQEQKSAKLAQPLEIEGLKAQREREISEAERKQSQTAINPKSPSPSVIELAQSKDGSLS